MKNNYMDLIYLQYTRFEHSTSVSNIAKEKRMGNTPFDHITYFIQLIPVIKALLNVLPLEANSMPSS
jgi:hypothetical protein